MEEYGKLTLLSFHLKTKLSKFAELLLHSFLYFIISILLIVSVKHFYMKI